MDGFTCAIIVAFVMNVSGIYVFTTSSVFTNREPLLSSILFLVSIGMILRKLTQGYYVSSHFKPTMFASWFLQFLLSAFVMEHAIQNFWFPLESTLFAALPKIADYEKSVYNRLGLPSFNLLNILRNCIVQSLFSYAVAIFCLAIVLMKSCLGMFLDDLARDMRKQLKRYYKGQHRISEESNECDY